MLFLDDINNMTKECDTYKYITKTMSNLEKALEIQYVKKQSLTQILDRIANMQIESVNLKDTKGLLSIIENIKEALDRISDNIQSEQKLLNELRDIISKIDNLMSKGEKEPRLVADLNYFYMLYIEKQNIIEESNIRCEKLLLNTYEYIFFNISSTENAYAIAEGLPINSQYSKEQKGLVDFEGKKEDIKKDNTSANINENKIEDTKKSLENCKEGVKSEITQEETENSRKNLDVENIVESKNDEETIKLDKSKETIEEIEEKGSKKIEEKQKLNQKIEDNDTLTISEKQNKVFLPYKVSDLEKMLNENPKEYNSLEDIINKKYVISLDRYKNATFARFKEAYLLMREKEKSSFSEALDLALELTFKSNLNPAIITACKNLDELDVYLDCLEDNNLEEFKIFNIKYDVAPMKI